MTDGLLTEVFREGHINTWIGVPRSGKSNTASLLSYYLAIFGWKVHTIIQYFDLSEIKEAIRLDKLYPEDKLPSDEIYSRVAPQMLTSPRFEKFLPGGKYLALPEEIDVNTRLSTLLKACLKPGRHVCWFDEGGLLAESTAPMSAKVRTIKKVAIMIGHLNACMNLLSQSEMFMSPVFRDDIITYQMRLEADSFPDGTFDRYMIIEKKSKIRDETNREVVDFKEVNRFHDILPSPIPYDNKFFAKFTIDLDIDMAYESLGEYNSVKVMTVADKIIDELVVEFASRKKKKKY